MTIPVTGAASSIGRNFVLDWQVQADEMVSIIDGYDQGWRGVIVLIWIFSMLAPYVTFASLTSISDSRMRAESMMNHQFW